MTLDKNMEEYIERLEWVKHNCIFNNYMTEKEVQGFVK